MKRALMGKKEPMYTVFVDIAGSWNYAVDIYVNDKLVFHKDNLVKPEGFEVSYYVGDKIRFELPGNYSYVKIDDVRYDYTNSMKIGYYGVDKVFTATGLHSFFVSTGNSGI